ncbi:helix-turn-helix transcriptional regulator [Enterobacter cancerogenus]|uniref:helix-turn-helix transcriptional regulator n=1 Tax=Enterobacter cancerogenus TaxID=69218 RepID=UPI00405805FE
MSYSLIRFAEVQKRTGYSKAWIYRLLKENRFPQSVKIGAQSIAFVESEIDEWISQRIEERDSLISTKPQL